MNRTMKRMLTLIAACVLLPMHTALADTISFSGTTAARKTHEVYAPIGGLVESVEVEVGQLVHAGDTLATLRTTKVYAAESGTITGVFGQIGDSAESVVEQYGAVMYMEGESVYTIAASTANAYNSAENKFVHAGEKVYLNCYSDGTHTGTGVITAISGTSYTVKVLSGDFVIGETVNVFRGEEAKSVNRIGRGVLSRVNPTAVVGSGSIVSYAVSDGDTVQRGDLLFETLEGAFDGFAMSGRQIVADVDGVIAQLNLTQGVSIEKDSVAATLYPSGDMCVEAQIGEADLCQIQEGDPVEVELVWNQDEEKTYQGVVAMISKVADTTATTSDTSGAAVTYQVYVDFAPDDNTRYGMTALVSTVDNEK